MSCPRKARAKLPLHVHAVKARGKDYYYYHPYRGTSREGERVSLPGAPFDALGIPNANGGRRTGVSREKGAGAKPERSAR